MYLKRLLLFTTITLSIALNNSSQGQIRHEENNNGWWGRTRGDMPALLFGKGTDRLGGTKIEYIDTNVVVKVIDSTSNLYQVRLSANHTAFINKEFIRRDFGFRPSSYYLTGNITTKGTDSGYDALCVNLQEKLPYITSMEIHPSRITLNLYGVQANTNWIIQHIDQKEISNVYYEQTEDDVVKLTIELKHTQHWGYSIGYEGNKLVLKIKQQPTLDIHQLKIAIDPGHGGDNTGAEGVKTGILEKNYTLLFAEALKAVLEKENITVIMTREKDTSLSIKERIALLKKANPDLLISLHLNATDNPAVNGSSTYYKYIGFRPLSEFILKRLLYMGMEDFGNVGNFNFGLNSPTDFVNCLVEIAFLSNAEDEEKIRDPAFRNKVANQIYQGIADWVNDLKENENINEIEKK